MGLENSKRWHWVVASLAVGPLLAFMNSQFEPGAGVPTMDAQEFVREVQMRDVLGGRPRLSNIVVHKPIEGAMTKPVSVVTVDRWRYKDQAKGWKLEQWKLNAEKPFDTSGGFRRGAPPPDQTVQSVLDDLAKKDARITYRDAWWEETPKAYAAWTGGALVVIGGIWPTVLSLLLGAGLGPKQSAEPEYDLERFGKAGAGAYDGDAAGAGKAPAKEMSDDERRRLQEQISAIEKNIGAVAVMTDVPAAGGASVAGPVKELKGGPLEVAAADKEAEDKEYKGEFYPVAKVVQHHDQPAEHSH